MMSLFSEAIDFITGKPDTPQPGLSPEEHAKSILSKHSGLELWSNKNQKLAQLNAEVQQNRANDLADRTNQFSVDVYNDWHDIYGDLQEDLSTYYQNLTGESLSNQQLTELQKESQNTQTQLDAQLAQRGLSGSGLEAQLLNQNLQNTATQKAGIRANAEQNAVNLKQNFLANGLGLQGSLAGNVTNAGNTAINSSTSLANSSLNSATQQQLANQQMLTDIAGIGGGLITGTATKPKVV